MTTVRRSLLRCAAAGLALVFLHTRSAADSREGGGLREILSWKSSPLAAQSFRPGAPFELPWFEEKALAAYTKEVRKSGDLTHVFANLAEAEGSIVLTVAPRGLTASIDTGGQSYRLNTLANGMHELVQVDVDEMMPDADDTDVPTDIDYRETKKKEPDDGVASEPSNDWADDGLELEMDRTLREVELLTDKMTLLRRRIDVVIGVTSEVVDWFDDQSYGYDFYTALEHMVAKANSALADSGAYVELRLIGARLASYTLVDSATFEQDLNNLRDQTTPGLQYLHSLRDQWGGDVLALLVMNGTESSCGIDKGRACGRAVTTRRIGTTADNPGSNFWNDTYRGYGVTIMHTPPALDSLTFVHEVGHILGAHHDQTTFVEDGSAPTADYFARGWILHGPKVRTIMAYRRLCNDIGIDCPIISYFSNPNLTYMGAPLGDWSYSGHSLGPAHNVKAINRMAWTVSNFRPTAVNP